MSQPTTMQLLQVARDMFDSGRTAASYRVIDEAQPDWAWRGRTASRIVMGGASGSYYRTLTGSDRRAIARRLASSTLLLDWANTLRVRSITFAQTWAWSAS